MKNYGLFALLLKALCFCEQLAFNSPSTDSYKFAFQLFCDSHYVVMLIIVQVCLHDILGALGYWASASVEEQEVIYGFICCDSHVNPMVLYSLLRR